MYQWQSCGKLWNFSYGNFQFLFANPVLIHFYFYIEKKNDQQHFDHRSFTEF